MTITIRNLFGALTLVAILIPFLLPRPNVASYMIVSSCVLPVAFCSFVAWWLLLRSNKASIAKAFVFGALAGLVGTLIWPSGFLTWVLLNTGSGPGNASGFIIGILMIVLPESIVLGGAIAATLTAGFPHQSRSSFTNC